MSISRLLLSRVSVPVLPLLLVLFGIVLLPPTQPRMQIATSDVYRNYLPAVQVGHWSPKKGLGVSYTFCDAHRVGATWYYSWYYQFGRKCPGEYLPMVYGEIYQAYLVLHPEWMDVNSRYLLGYNEPDNPDQADITPERAAVLWRELEALFPYKLLVSPAVSQIDPYWLEDWYDAYVNLYGEPPRMVVVAGHCYYLSCEQFITCAETLIAIADQWGLPVWITEFAPHIAAYPDYPNKAAAIEDSRCVLKWLEGSRIERYAWFVSRLSGEEPWVGSVDYWCVLFDYDSGHPTVWGDLYGGRSGVW